MDEHRESSDECIPYDDKCFESLNLFSVRTLGLSILIFLIPAYLGSFLPVNNSEIYMKTYCSLYFMLCALLSFNLVQAQETKELKTVVISGTKPVVKQGADRIIYDVQADPDSKGSNLAEIMRKIPFLSVDLNENLLFRGQADFRVFINGKPSSMMDRNLKEVLRSMPASTIQKIEVITNPSSKYDAEGLAGIINIVTKNLGLEGYNGTFNFSERHPVGGPGLGSAFNYKQGKTGITAYGGASQFSRPATQITTDRSSHIDGTLLEQQSSYETSNPSGYFGTEISFEVDTLNLLTAQVNVNGSRTKDRKHQFSVLNDGATLSQQYRMDNTNRTISKGWDASLNYQMGFSENKDRLLTFSYRYLTYQNLLNSAAQFLERLQFPTGDYAQENDGRLQEHTLQADYVYRFKGVAAEAGIKLITRQNESNFKYISDAHGLDPAMSSGYLNDQQVWAMYNSYQFKIRRWGIKLGLRLEATQVNADFTTDGASVYQEYLNFIPNVSASTKIQEKGNLNIGFAQRIKRPGINKLNPFVDRSNPSFEISGNPNLTPSLINNVMIGYNLNTKLAVTTGLNFSWVKSLFVQASTFDPVTQITRTTFENTGKAQALDADLNLRYTFSTSWNASVNMHGTYMLLEATTQGKAISNNWTFYNMSFTSGYNFDKTWRLMASLSLKSRNMVNLQGTTNGFVATSFGMNKDFPKHKLSFSASLNNPFSKYRNNITETVGPNFFQMDTTWDYFRNYALSVNYRFGKLKEAMKKNRRSINNDDLSN